MFVCNGFLGICMSYVFAYDVDMELDGIWIGMLIGGGSNCLL